MAAINILINSGIVQVMVLLKMILVDDNDGGDVDLMMKVLYLLERMIMMVVVIKLTVMVMWLMKDTRP